MERFLIEKKGFNFLTSPFFEGEVEKPVIQKKIEMDFLGEGYCTINQSTSNHAIPCLEQHQQHRLLHRGSQCAPLQWSRGDEPRVW